jgi:type II secretory pathway pseudopilin PulG
MRRASAFTLLEVLFAVAVLGGIFYTVVSMQIQQGNRAMEAHERLRRLYLVKKQLSRTLLSPPKSDKKIIEKLEDPECTITTGLEEIDKRSELKRFAKSIRMVRARAVWKQWGNERTINMVTFVPSPKETK